jgi:hypothetical protein
MTHAKGIEWLNNSFIVATRADQAPRPLPTPAFPNRCSQCGAKTLTEKEYPQDIPIVCTVCAREVVRQLDQDDATRLLFNMPIDVKARLLDTAFQQRLPIEDVVRNFLEWKVGGVKTATLQTTREQNEEK